MAFNNSFTAVTGATYTAAQYNTHVRDNLTAIWVYTTQGDIAYATSATTLNRLAKVTGGVLYGGATGPAYTAGGARGSILLNTAANTPGWKTVGAVNSTLVSDGTDPQWVTPANMGFIPGLLHTSGFASFGDIGQTSTNTSFDTNVTSATLNITTTRTCTILMTVHALLATGAAGHQAKIRGSIGGTVDPNANNYGTSGSTAYVGTPYQYRRTGVGAGTITCLLKFGSTNSGVSAFIERGGIHVMAFVE